jgi:hypothetical protein
VISCAADDLPDLHIASEKKLIDSTVGTAAPTEAAGTDLKLFQLSQLQQQQLQEDFGTFASLLQDFASQLPG